jgi:hypothetical protein
MKKSNKILIPIIIAVCAFLIIINNFVKPGKDKILAQINDETIYLADFQDQAQKYGQYLSKEDKKLLLQSMVGQKIVKIYADKNNFFDDPENKKEFEWQRNEAKKGLLLKIFLEKKSEQSIKLSDEDYEAYIKEYPFIKIKTIFVRQLADEDSTRAKRKIYKAYDKLQSGENFESVMKKFTKKQYRMAKSKPELIKMETFKRLLAGSSEGLEIGKYTKPISTSKGYYIIKRCNDPTLDEIKEQARDDIKNQKESAFLNDYIADFKSNIVIFNKNLQSAFSAADASSQSNKLIASYEKYKLTYGMLRKYLENLFTEGQLNQMRFSDIENFANQIALQDFLYQRAISEHIDTTAFFVEQWKAQEQEFERNWEDFIIGKVYKDVITPAVDVSEDEINEYYQKNRNEFMENGQIKTLPKVKYDIMRKLRTTKYQQWLDKVKQDYQIEIVKNEKYL